MQFDKSYLTEAGRSVATSVVGGLDKVQFTKAVASTHDYSKSTVSDIKQLAELDGIQQSVDISKVTKTNDTTVDVRIAFPSINVTAAYSLYTVGLYAKLLNGDEILYSVVPAEVPDYIAAYDNESNLTDTFDLSTTVGDADNVQITVSQAGMVNEDDVNAIIDSRHYVTQDDIKLPTGLVTESGSNKFTGTNDFQKATVKGVNVATTADVDNKVTDNKNDTIQVNGTRVNPYNKLTDSVGGRNLLLGTSPAMVNNSTWNNIINVDVTKLVGTTLTYSAILDITKSTQGTVAVSISLQDSSGKSIGDSVPSNYIKFRNIGKAIATITIPAGASNLRISEWANNTNSNPWVGSRKLEQGSIATDWTPAPEDKVNVSDMRKPASDVAGIEEVNAKQDKIGYTPADDSKVSHLSGANNFDTVPTVNNNPLLLASSLPSDLARTGQDANFTGKLQKSGIDVATATDVTNAVNTATANMADFTKATNFTAGLQSGGINVATAADLKSVEDSAWRELDLSGTSGLYKGKIRIKIDDATKTIYLDGAMYFPSGTSPSQGTALIDLSKVVNSITSSHGYLFFITGTDEHAIAMGSNLKASTIGYNGAKIKINMNIDFYQSADYILPFPDAGKSNIYITYDKLV